MPILSIARFFATLVSLLIVGIAVYLLWTWYQGDLIQEADGDMVRVREDWRLWVPLALLAFSCLGRFLLLPLLARHDDERPSRPERSNGKIIEGASGARLYVEELGAVGAPVVILTHGWAMDSTIWNYAKQDLSRDFRVIAWDLPGLGKSTGEISLESFARNLAVLVERAGPGPVILVGHSIGGMTVQTLARDNPAFFSARIAGAVLVNTTYTNPLETIILSPLLKALRRPVLEPVMRLTIALQPLAWLSLWQSYLNGTSHVANRLGFGKYVTRSQLDHTTLLTTRNPPGNVQKGNLAMFRWDATKALKATPVPILVLGGEWDIVTKPEAGADLAGQAGAEFVRMEGANHMGFLERHDSYISRIAAFTRQVSTSTRDLSSGNSA